MAALPDNIEEGAFLEAYLQTKIRRFLGSSAATKIIPDSDRVSFAFFEPVPQRRVQFYDELFRVGALPFQKGASDWEYKPDKILSEGSLTITPEIVESILDKDAATAQEAIKQLTIGKARTA